MFYLVTLETLGKGYLQEELALALVASGRPGGTLWVTVANSFKFNKVKKKNTNLEDHGFL